MYHGRFKEWMRRFKGASDTAWPALPQGVRVRFTGADGRPNAPFGKLYDALQETEPTL